MKLDLFIDIQEKSAVASATSTAAASLTPWFRGDTVELSIFPLSASRRVWAPYATFPGAPYSVIVGLFAPTGVQLATSSVWTWGHDDDDGGFPPEVYNRWSGKLVLTPGVINPEMSGDTLECKLEVEISRVVMAVTEYSTVLQTELELKRDLILH